MATGWHKIKGHYYYFKAPKGALVTSSKVGKYYVNSKGQRYKKSSSGGKPKVTHKGNTTRIKAVL